MNRLKAEWKNIGNMQATHKEAGRKAAGNGDARRGGKEKKAQGPGCSSRLEKNVEMPVEGC